ncbi:phosphatase PAP2 family protein [Streptomyces sp. NPDC008240]|uniref:phosphatase PAP2 family protein n=1 Tax=Streptomyces sp. NPDC008240 TaxID=3364822 RepID=UPI0036E553F8
MKRSWVQTLPPRRGSQLEQSTTCRPVAEQTGVAVVGLVSPSGHTAAAVAFTATVAATWPAAGAACALPAAMVALERVQSGAHYPTNVAAGSAIGLASA